MKRLLPLLLLPPSLSACSLYIQGILDEAAANVVAEGEGEEGEGEEGEGEEGEGEEGEGEIPDTDPACEDEERVLVVRDDSEDALQVYDNISGRFRRRFSEGNSAPVALDNDNTDAQNNGYGASAVAIGTNNRMYIVGDRFLYQLERSTLTQQDITGKVMVTLSSFGAGYSVQVAGGRIITAGTDLLEIAEGAGVGVNAAEIEGPNDEYHRSIRFSVEGEDFVAINSRFGFVVLSSVGGAAPTPTVVHDEDFVEDRFHEYGGGTFSPRGIAFDQTTKKLLLGDPGRVIVLKHSNGFSVAANPPENDYVLPNASESLVQAIAARGGFAYVLLERSTDNLIKLDLSTEPPTAVDIATVDTGIGFGRTMAVGCRRIVIGAQTGIVGVDRETLSEFTRNDVGDVEQVQIVSRSALGLLGDDGE